jgi:hypothetical protein
LDFLTDRVGEIRQKNNTEIPVFTLREFFHFDKPATVDRDRSLSQWY